MAKLSVTPELDICKLLSLLHFSGSSNMPCILLLLHQALLNQAQPRFLPIQHACDHSESTVWQGLQRHVAEALRVCLLCLHVAGGDIDALCVGPRHVSRSMFFGTEPYSLQRMLSVSQPLAVHYVFVPLSETHDAKARPSCTDIGLAMQAFAV